MSSWLTRGTLLVVLAAGCGSGTPLPKSSEQTDNPSARGDSGAEPRPGSGNVGQLGDSGAADHDDGSAGDHADAGPRDPADAGPDAAVEGCVRTGVERCNGLDDDCNGKVDDGFDVGAGCDGADDDECKNGVFACDDRGSVFCDESTANSAELCDGIDNDCDGSSDEGFDIGSACDGDDADRCMDGKLICDGPDATRCVDDRASAVDLCNGLDDDCDPHTADGSGEPTIGEACDGADRDSCKEGVIQCTGSLRCSDTSDDALELCNGLDDDCDPGTADGSGDPQLGAACDGADADLCKEGSFACDNGIAGLNCTDATSATVELCNALDDDCDTKIDETILLETAPACAGATNAGTVRGDFSASGNVTDTIVLHGHTEAWYALTVSDTSSTAGSPIAYVSASVTLESAAGTDFDLYVYCLSCGGALAGSSVENDDIVDFVDLRRNETNGDETFKVLIEVDFFEAAVCADWTLTLEGNTEVDKTTCN